MSLSGPEPGNLWCPSQCCALHCAADPGRSGQGLALPCCFLWMFLHSRLLRLVSNQSLLHKIKSSWIQWIYLLTYHILTKNLKNYFLEVSVLKQFRLSHEHGKGCPGHHPKNYHLWGGRQVLVFSFMTAWPFLPGVSRSTSRNRSQDTECQSQITSWKGRFSLLWNVPKTHVFFGLGHTPKNIRVRCQRLNLEGAATLPSAGSQGYMTRTHYTDHNII